VSEDGEEVRVIGSIAELEEIAGRKVGAVSHNLFIDSNMSSCSSDMAA
jgi:hypothetical protein